MSHMHWMTSFSFIELAIRIFMSSSSRFGFLGTGSPFGHPLIWYWRIDKGSRRFKGNKQFRQNSIAHVHLNYQNLRKAALDIALVINLKCKKMDRTACKCSLIANLMPS